MFCSMQSELLSKKMVKVLGDVIMVISTQNTFTRFLITLYFQLHCKKSLSKARFTWYVICKSISQFLQNAESQLQEQRFFDPFKDVVFYGILRNERSENFHQHLEGRTVILVLDNGGQKPMGTEDDVHGRTLRIRNKF